MPRCADLGWLFGWPLPWEHVRITDLPDVWPAGSNYDSLCVISPSCYTTAMMCRVPAHTALLPGPGCSQTFTVTCSVPAYLSGIGLGSVSKVTQAPDTHGSFQGRSWMCSLMIFIRRLTSITTPRSPCGFDHQCVPSGRYQVICHRVIDL